MHGAVKQIPISPNVQDECHDYIFGEKGFYSSASTRLFPNDFEGQADNPSAQRAQPSMSPLSEISGSIATSLGIGWSGKTSNSSSSSNIIFAAVEAEVLDYLVSEVYPSFEKTSLSLIARKHSHEMMEVIKSGLSAGRRGSLFNSPDKVSNCNNTICLFFVYIILELF